MKVFCGDDSFESYNKLFEEASQISKKTNSEIKIINEDEITLDFFIDNLSSIDMFSTKYVYILKRALNKKEVSQYILDNIENLLKEDILIWSDSSLDKRSSVYKGLKSRDLIIEFTKLSDRELREWTIKELKLLNIKLESEALEYLLLNSSSNKWIIKSNIKKLELLNKGSFKLNDVKNYINLNSNGNIWDFLDYFSSRKKDKAIKEMETLLSVNDNTQYLISMLQREIKIMYKLLIIKRENKDIFKYIKLAPFQLKTFQRKALNFKKVELEKLMERLFNIDLKIKKGEIEDKLALTLFLVTL